MGLTFDGLRAGALTLIDNEIATAQAEHEAAIAPYQERIEAADALDKAGFSEMAAEMRGTAQATIDAATAGHALNLAIMGALRGNVEKMTDADLFPGDGDALASTELRSIVIGFIDRQVQFLQAQRTVMESLRVKANAASDEDLGQVFGV